jgi:long-chain acyl-CoA synthetase
MMDRYWLHTYPNGLAPDINPDAFSSVAEILKRACIQYASRIAFQSFDMSLSFQELNHQSDLLARALVHRYQLKKGDRVAVMMPNILQYPITIMALLRAGLVVVNTNPLYTPRELQHQLNDAEVSLIIAFENAASVVAEALPQTKVKHVLLTRIGDRLGLLKGTLINVALKYLKKQIKPYRLPQLDWFNDVLNEGLRYPSVDVEVASSDIAFLQYTGGTTGVSKGAVLTHRNMVANILQCEAWLDTFERNRDQIQVIAAALPMYHIFALTAIALLWVHKGGRSILIANPRDTQSFVKLLLKIPCTVYFGVNTLFNALLNHPQFSQIDFSKVNVCVAGGMALQGSVANRWLQATGCELTQGWGLTETSPVLTIMPPNTAFNNAAGKPVPSTEIGIVNDDGDFLPVGSAGEIVARGPQIMAGYWRRADETALVLLPGGWFKTGDIGRMDAEGFVYIEDRKKDMILVSGFNVYPNEVEEVLSAHPGIVEVAAVAKPDERSGESVAVFVVKRDPLLSAEAIIQYARQGLTNYKVPQSVIFKTELPKTNVGKILRRALRDELDPKPNHS